MDDLKNPMPTGERVVGKVARLRVRQTDAVPVAMRGRVREVVDVEVDAAHQNKGYATRLMNKTCEEADAANVVLLLWPFPYGEDQALTENQLVEWYNRSFGFAVIQTNPILMARMPNSKPVVMRLNKVTEGIYKGMRT